MNGQTRANGVKVGVPVLGDWRPVHIGGMPTQPDPEPEPAAVFPDAVAEAEAAAIRSRSYAESEAARIKAEAEAEAIRIGAEQKAERERIANERAAMRLEKERADHTATLARKAKEAAEANAATERAEKTAADQADKAAQQLAEQQRSESWWKWGARGIYAVGLAIAAPVQFLDFWDPRRPFMVVAPALLEGFALVLAFGAAWAVAHRRDVMPYRIGIMLGAMIAAGVNLRGGMTNPVIGLNAGIIGAVASLGGPIVLMAYEHGMAQKADGIASWRERRAATKQAAEEQEAKDRAKAEREQAVEKAAADKEAQRAAAEAEQQRKDADRRSGHEDVWKVAEALRSARGSATVTEQIWGEAWLLVTGSRHVGIRPEIEALSRDAQARMKAAANGTQSDDLLQVESQIPTRPRRDPDAPDGRRLNGGTPPRRTPGDATPFHTAAKAAAADTARQYAAQKDA